MFSRNKVLKPSESKRLEQLELDFDDLKREFDRVAIQHQTLQGRFYARFGKGDIETQGPSKEVRSKDDLRRMAGLRAGRPAPHKQET